MNLPDHLVVEFLRNLDGKSLKEAALVCKRLVKPFFVFRFPKFLCTAGTI